MVPGVLKFVSFLKIGLPILRKSGFSIAELAQQKNETDDPPFSKQAICFCLPSLHAHSVQILLLHRMQETDRSLLVFQNTRKIQGNFSRYVIIVSASYCHVKISKF